MTISLTYNAASWYFEILSELGNGISAVNSSSGNLEIDRVADSASYIVELKFSRKLFCFAPSPQLRLRVGHACSYPNNTCKVYFRNSLTAEWVRKTTYASNVGVGTTLDFGIVDPTKDYYFKIEMVAGTPSSPSKFSIANMLYTDASNFGSNSHLFNMADESTLNSQIEQNYILKSTVQQNYTLNSLIDQNYYLKSYVEANYTLTTDLQNDYILRSIVEADYTLKADLQVNYVERTSPLVLTTDEQQFFLNEVGERILEVKKV